MYRCGYLWIYVIITLNSIHVFKLQYNIYNSYLMCVFSNMLFYIMHWNEHTFCSEFVNRTKLYSASYLFE